MRLNFGEIYAVFVMQDRSVCQQRGDRMSLCKEGAGPDGFQKGGASNTVERTYKVSINIMELCSR